MILAILAENEIKQEILDKGIPESIEVIWVDSIRSLCMIEADAWFDLQFEPDPERTAQLKKIQAPVLFIGSNEYTCAQIGIHCTRINDWPGFINRPILELATPSGILHPAAAKLLEALHWDYEITPDIPGFISSRVVASLVNEAYYTLQQQVSSKQDIDTAMKFGTNYPYGPFEWSGKIGLKKIASLLHVLAHKDDRYTVSKLLEQEAEELD